MPARRTRTRRESHLTYLARTGRARILIVDADGDARELYSAVLDAHGHEVVTVGHAHDAARAIAERRPDVVVTELALPDVDGIEICRLVGRRFGRRVPVIVVTALDSAYYKASAKIAGAARVLTKPCAPGHLERCVHDLIGTWDATVCRAADLTRTIRGWIRQHPAHEHAWSRPVMQTKARTRDGLVVATMLTSQAGVILDTDAGVADLTGYRGEHLVGTAIWELCPPTARDEYRAVWRWFQTSGRLRGMVSLVDADGAVRGYQYESARRLAIGANVCAFTPSASAPLT